MSLWQLLGQPAQDLLWAFNLFFEIYIMALAALFALCLSTRLLVYWTISKKLVHKRSGH